MLSHLKLCLNIRHNISICPLCQLALNVMEARDSDKVFLREKKIALTYDELFNLLQLNIIASFMGNSHCNSSLDALRKIFQRWKSKILNFYLNLH